MVDKNIVRIIGGKYKNRKINILPNSDIRPTADRIRETVFNWLMFDIVNSRILDLFAGSGAMTLEALSRQAKFVYCNDSNPAVISHIDNNIKNIDHSLSSDSKKLQLANYNALELLQKKPQDLNLEPFDIIILDPPFNKNYLQSCLELIVKNNWLAKKYSDSSSTLPAIYIESEQQLNINNILLSPSLKKLTLVKLKTTGNVCYGLLSL
ncbi:MAG: 16S rRNA (guanine(966)-N(2))-methyltransferase RsmD [Gammaproteobacteria bacterium]|nr:16S rRNA (guanine(966)-N(2))-methyltransferase RsmD [Gammaproteobacteria bacterium]